MTHKNNTSKNALNSSFTVLPPSSPLSYFQKPSFSTNFIDTTTVSISDDYQLQAQAIISNLNKLSFHLHMISQLTLDRLQHTVVGFYNQCILPWKHQVKRQPTTPQYNQQYQHQQFQYFPSDKKKAQNHSSIIQQSTKSSELEAEMLKIQKLKKELKEDNVKKENILTLKAIQQKFIGKNKVADIYIYMNKLLKEILNKVEKPDVVKGLIPHIKDVYQHVWKMNRSKEKLCEIMCDFQNQMGIALDECQDWEEQWEEQRRKR